MTKLTDRLAAWVLDTPRWKFLTVLFLFMFLRTGITPVAWELAKLAKDPYALPAAWVDEPNRHFLFWSWLGPFLAHLCHATTTLRFTLFYLAFSIAFTALMTRWLFTRLDEPKARVAMLIFALLPVSGIPYYWVWIDSLTLFLLVVALYFPRGWPVLVVLGIALGMHHFEQGAFAAASATFALAWAQRRGHRGTFTWMWGAAILAGTVIGRSILVAIFAHLDIELSSGRWWWLFDMWVVMLKRFAYTFHATLFSIFGVAWFVVIGFVRREHPAARPTAFALLGLMLLLPISDDPTRVYAIVSFLVVATLVFTDSEFLGRLDRATVGRLALAWIVVPFVFVWSGRVMVAATGYNVLTSIDGVFQTSAVFKDPRTWF